jgi:hypothetical protein
MTKHNDFCKVVRRKIREINKELKPLNTLDKAPVVTVADVCRCEDLYMYAVDEAQRITELDLEDIEAGLYTLGSTEEAAALRAKFNDFFGIPDEASHLTCSNYPNCDSEGCGGE